MLTISLPVQVLVVGRRTVRQTQRTLEEEEEKEGALEALLWDLLRYALLAHTCKRWKLHNISMSKSCKIYFNTNETF